MMEMMKFYAFATPEDDLLGPTTITIESKMTRRLRTIKESKAEGQLMPTTWFIGSNTL